MVFIPAGMKKIGEVMKGEVKTHAFPSVWITFLLTGKNAEKINDFSCHFTLVIIIYNKYIMISFNHLRIQRDSSISITDQLVQQLASLVSLGKIGKGERLPPIRSAARQLGVHMHTVMAAYHRLEGQGMLVTRPGSGTVVLEYKPFSQQADFSSPGILKVGVILPELDSLHSQMLTGLHQALDEEGVSMELALSGYDPANAEPYLDRLIRQGISGVINFSSGFTPQFNSLRQSSDGLVRIPLVFANVPGLPESALTLDVADAAYQAAVHLVEHGHTALGLINLPEEWPLGNAIHQGFTRGLSNRSAGVGQMFIRSVTRLTIESGHEAGMQFCRSALRPTALLAFNDRLAIGAIQAFRAHGLRVPQDMAVIACFDSDLVKYTQPGITAFSASAGVMGYQAGRLMIQYLGLQPADTAEIKQMPISLVRRSSCGCSVD